MKGPSDSTNCLLFLCPTLNDLESESELILPRTSCSYTWFNVFLLSTFSHLKSIVPCRSLLTVPAQALPCLSMLYDPGWWTFKNNLYSLGISKSEISPIQCIFHLAKAFVIQLLTYISLSVQHSSWKFVLAHWALHSCWLWTYNIFTQKVTMLRMK